MTFLNSYGKIANHDDIIPPVPEDIDLKISGWWYGGFIVVKEQPNELTLKSTNYEKDYPVIKIKPEGFNIIGTPAFVIGDTVNIKNKNKQGTIYGIAWHYKRECFYYFVEYSDRKSTCMYFDEDFEKVTSA